MIKPVEQEIRDRQLWLQDMISLGRGEIYKKQIQAEIDQVFWVIIIEKVTINRLEEFNAEIKRVLICPTAIF